MKRYIHSSEEEIFAMSKVIDKYANRSVVGDIGKFIYFSECNSSHSPRIKFYGGTKESSSTQNAPTLSFDIEGNCKLELADWMNKKNCPNAFDADYVSKVENFIQRVKPILLLVWFQHLDEGDALAYFHGQIDLKELLKCCEFYIPEEIDTIDGLDRYCKSCQFYKF